MNINNVQTTTFLSNYYDWANKNKLKNKLLLNFIIYIVFVCYYIQHIDEFEHSIQNTNKQSTNDIISVIYFGLTTHTTVGFGDIIPNTNRLKFIISMHILLSFIVNLIL